MTNTSTNETVDQLAFDVTGDPEFPERAAFEAARDQGLRVTTHAGVWGATGDDSIRLMCDHGFMTSDVTCVHAASLSHDSYQRIAASGAFASVSTESEQSAGQGYPPTFALRRHGIPVSLSMDTSVWWAGDLFSAMRATLSADRSREHLETQSSGETVVHNALRADVHTVMVNGRVLKHDHELRGVDLQRAKDEVGRTIDHLRSQMGEEAWHEGMSPELPARELFDNPYQYTDWGGGRGAKGVVPSA